MPVGKNCPNCGGDVVAEEFITIEELTNVTKIEWKGICLDCETKFSWNDYVIIENSSDLKME